jgi:hypothetical protein
MRTHFLSTVLTAGHRTGIPFKMPRRMRLGNFLNPPPRLLKIQREEKRQEREAARLQAEQAFKDEPIDLDPRYLLRIGAIIQRDPLVMRKLPEVEEEYAKYRFLEDAQQSRGLLLLSDAEEDTGIRADANGVRYFNIPPEESESPVEYSTDDSNQKNLGRMLDRKLYLAIKPIHAPNQWTFPAFLYSKEHEGLHQCLRSILTPIFPEAQLYHLGPTPVAHHMEKHDGQRQLATFYLKSILIQGDVRNLRIAEALDYGWLTKEELEKGSDPRWFRSLAPILSNH